MNDRKKAAKIYLKMSDNRIKNEVLIILKRLFVLAERVIFYNSLKPKYFFPFKELIK